MYTGVIPGADGKLGEYCDMQTQCIAVGDGVDYKKYEMNPVLDKTDLPAGSDVA